MKALSYSQKVLVTVLTCFFFSQGYANPAHSGAPVAWKNNPQAKPDTRELPSRIPQMAPRNSLPGIYETNRSPARLIYLNGSNVSSLRGQELENVSVKIDEHGNIHITAAHYEVSEQPSYHPLLRQELPQFPRQGTLPASLPNEKFSKYEGADKNP